MSIHEYQVRLLSITTVAQSILQEFLVNAAEELLAQSPHLAQPNTSAVSTILSPYIKIFEKDTILKIPNNKKKVFDVKGTGIALSNPNVSTFDVSMICAILKRIPDFDTHNPDKVNRCVNNCIQKCCPHCNHKKVNCGNCLESFTECRFKKNLCCPRCQICGFCQVVNPLCDVFKLKKNLDVIRRARNIAAHGSMDEFTKLEKNGIPLEDFPNSNTWLDLSAEISNAVSAILSYMRNPQNFPSSNKLITSKQKNDYEIEMKIACEGSAIIVERNFNAAIFQMVSHMREPNEELDHLADFLKDCIEKKLIDIHVMLTSHIDNFTRFDEQNEVRYKKIERVLKANRKLLETLNEKYAIDIEAVKNDIKTQKVEQQKVIERIEVAEVNVTKLKVDQVMTTKTIEDIKLDVCLQKDEQLQVKERIHVTEAELVAQKKKQLELKEQIDVTEAEVFTIKEKIGCLNPDMNQSLSTNQSSVSEEMIRDDGSSHSFQMRDCNWYLSCHHDNIDQPEVLINRFDRNIHAPGAKKVLKSYQCGYTKYDNEAGYAKYLTDKFDEQFGKDLIDQPWLLTNLHEDCVENRNFYQLCRDINSFCQNKKYSFLLIDVSIEDNLRNLEFDVKKVQEQLNVYEAEDPADRILLYIGESDVMLNIRYVDSDNEKDISDAVKKGQIDTKLFCSLYQDVFLKTNISFISMVVANTTKKNLLEIRICAECVSENLIVPSSGLCTTLQRVVDTREERKKYTSSSVPTKRTFIDIASRLWGTLSIRDVHLPNLCTDRDSALERIYLNGAQRRFLHSKKKHAILCGGFGSGKSVLAQQKFKYFIQNAKKNEDVFYLCFNDESLFKDVFKEQISKTVHHQLRSEQIFIMNSDEYGKQFGLLPPVMFSEILQDINERYKQSLTKPHIIAGEFDSSNLTSNEADSIRNVLPEFQDSYILLIPHSLETMRKQVSSSMLRKQEEKYDGHELERTGMSITRLDSIMRNTTINELSQATIRELQKFKSKINISDSPVNIESNKKDVFLENVEQGFDIANKPQAKESLSNNSHNNATNMQMVTYSDKNCKATLPTEFIEIHNYPPISDINNSSTTLQNLNLVDNNNDTSNEKELSTIGQMHPSKKQDDILNDSIPNIAIDIITDKPLTSEDENCELNLQRIQEMNSSKGQELITDSNSIPVNFYHVLKKMNLSVEKHGRRSIESQFRFFGKGYHGHKVRGTIPLLIDPLKNIELNYDTINETEVKTRLLFALQNIINVREKSRGMAVIVFEPIEAQLFHAIFLSMDINTIVYTPAISTGLMQTSRDAMVNKLKDHLLVTDHIGIRGLEFKHLLVTLNPNEVFLYQHLVEAFTRCLYELSFIVFNAGVKEKGIFSSGNVIKLWEKNDLVQKYEIKICELHEEGIEKLDLYCKKMNRCYHIHTWHKDLRQAKTIGYIRCISNRDEQLRVQYNKLLSHAYMEEEVRRKQEKQMFSKECTRRGYKTYKDIILGNDKTIVNMLLQVKDRSYLTKFHDEEGRSLLETAFLHCCSESIEAIVQSGLELSLRYKKLSNALNNHNVVYLLLRFKRNHMLDYRDINGKTLMHIASENSAPGSVNSCD